MVPVPSGVRVWLAVGRTDMRRGMNSLALQVQETLRRDPHAGDLYVLEARVRERGYTGGPLSIIDWTEGMEAFYAFFDSARFGIEQLRPSVWKMTTGSPDRTGYE